MSKQIENITKPLAQFQLKAMSTDFFHLINAKEVMRNDKVSLSQKELSIQYDIHSEVGFLFEHKVVQTKIDIIIHTNQNDKRYNLCEITTAFDFQISNMEHFVIKQGKEIDLPKEVMSAFINIGISTTRGILFEKLSGTFLAATVMPLIFPTHENNKGKVVKEKK